MAEILRSLPVGAGPIGILDLSEDRVRFILAPGPTRSLEPARGGWGCLGACASGRGRMGLVWTIRGGAPEDAAEIAALAERDGQTGLARDIRVGFSRHEVLVADRDGTLIGFIEGRYTSTATAPWAPAPDEGPHAFMHNLLVDPAHRSRGIGRALVDEFAAEATARGAVLVALMPSPIGRVEDRRRFFLACGFSEVMDDGTLVMTARLPLPPATSGA